MLIPFSEVKFHSPDFDGKFVPSFLNDIARDGEFQNGILICETSNKTGYVLISDGRAVLSRGIAFSNEGEVFASVPIESFLEEQHLELTLASVKNDNVLKYLSDFLAYPHFICSPYRFVNVPFLVSYLSGQKESALIAFKHGQAIDIVAFDKGNFSFLALFDSRKNVYIFEDNPVNFGAYLGNLDITKPIVLGIKISENLFSSFGFSSGLDFIEKDLVSEEAGVYFNAFSAVFKVFAEILPPENVAALAGKILSYLKGKYPQVYSLLEYSPERGTVNWESLLETRKFVAEEYRFAAYHGYLDEILLLLLRSANSLLKPREMKALELDVRVLFQGAEDKNKDFSGMFDRFDKLLKILQ
ncbi:hypothetical protein J6Z19_06220 [bacterium]|nr:hypothetical protein [bacterium]